MNLPTEVFDEVVVVHVPEELGAEQCEEFEEYLAGLQQSNIVLALEGTETIDSQGLTTLLEVQQKLHQENGEIKLVAGNFTNRKIFEITRLDQQLEVFESVLDAVKSFR